MRGNVRECFSALFRNRNITDAPEHAFGRVWEHAFGMVWEHAFGRVWEHAFGMTLDAGGTADIASRPPLPAPHTTPLPFSFASFPASTPQSSPRISAVCSPSIGGRVTVTGLSDKCSGELTVLKVPLRGG